MDHDVMLADKPIGVAQVNREGLYYRFRCRCRLSGSVMYQLVVQCEDRENSLGICVPMDDMFGVETRLPIKAVGEGELSFYAIPRHADIKGRFIPIRPEEPFMYLEKLEKAQFQMQDGEPGLLIP